MVMAVAKAECGGKFGVHPKEIRAVLVLLILESMGFSDGED